MDLTVTAGEAFRLLAVIDVLVLFGCAVYLHGGYGHELPGPLRRLGYAYGALLVMIVLAVLANYLSTAPPTVGVKLFGVMAALPAAYVLTMTVQVARGKR